MHTSQTFTSILAFSAVAYGAPVKRRDSTISTEDVQMIEERAEAQANGLVGEGAGIAAGGTKVEAVANANVAASAAVNARQVAAGAGAAAGLAAVTYSDINNIAYLVSALTLNVCTRVELDTLGQIAAKIGTGTVIGVAVFKERRDQEFLQVVGSVAAGVGAVITTADGRDWENLHKIQAYLQTDDITQVDLDNIARLCLAIRAHAGVVLQGRDLATISTKDTAAAGAALNITTTNSNNLIKIVGAVAADAVTQAQLDWLAQIAKGLRSNVRYAVATTNKTTANTVDDTVLPTSKDLYNLATINAAFRSRAMTQVDLDNIDALAASVEVDAHFSTY